MRASRQPWGWDGADLVPQKDTGQWSERSRDVLSMNGMLTLGGGNLPDGGDTVVSQSVECQAWAGPRAGEVLRAVNPKAGPLAHTPRSLEAGQ